MPKQLGGGCAICLHQLPSAAVQTKHWLPVFKAQYGSLAVFLLGGLPRERSCQTAQTDVSHVLLAADARGSDASQSLQLQISGRTWLVEEPGWLRCRGIVVLALPLMFL